MKPYGFVLGVLCVWRITHLLYAEDGPWDLVARLRLSARGPFASSVLGCFYCLSMWVAVPVAGFAGGRWMLRVLSWPALSAGAILVDLLAARLGIPQARYFRDEEEGNALLRQDIEA